MLIPCFVLGARPCTSEKSNVTVSCELLLSFDDTLIVPEMLPPINSTLYSFASSRNDCDVFEPNACASSGARKSVAASATEHTAVILSDDDDDALFLVSNESAGDDVARARARLLLAPH